MAFGWQGKILFINLSDRKIEIRNSEPYYRDYLGGRAFASKIAWDEIPNKTDAFSPDNRIIISTGPFTGTISPTSGRTIMSSISPRTYPFPWYTHSTFGGWFGPELKYAGYDAIVIFGESNEPVYINICDDDVAIEPANELWGLDARKSQILLKNTLGNRCQILTIGPAGENLVRFASVQHSEDNAAAHSGFGAVWGKKKLKAICVQGNYGIKIAKPDKLLNEVLGFGNMKVTPSTAVVWGGNDPKTPRPVCSQSCNFNCYLSRYALTVDERRIPGQCISGVWNSGMSWMKGTKYENGNIRIPEGVNFGLCEEVSLHEKCNSLGLDLWFRLIMQPWLIRCQEVGINEIRGIEIKPKDVFWFDEFMDQLAYRKGLGEIFSDDLIRAMDQLEGELPEELINLGREMEFGFGFPAHREGRFWDEEPMPFWVISAMMYASESRDPSIGSHQSLLSYGEFLLADKEISTRQFERISENVWGDKDALKPTLNNKAPLAIWTQHHHMLIDSYTMCDFAFPQVIRSFTDETDWRNSTEVRGDIDLDIRLLEAITGIKKDRNELFGIAERAFTLERLLLARAGRNRKYEEVLAPHFKLPCRADGTFMEINDFSKLLDEYYTERNWDLKLGWPKDELLMKIGLTYTIPEIQGLREEKNFEKKEDHFVKRGEI